jgi:hypothetical protein
VGDPVVAEIAFFRYMVGGMEKSHAVRAGHDAVAAPDTPFPVDQDYSVCGLIGRPHRAYLNTGRFVTLVAEFRHKKSLIDSFRGHLSVSAQPQVDAAGGESIPGFLGGVGQYFSSFGNDVSFHPGPGNIGLKGDFIFEFAGLDTEAAANALIRIHKKYPAGGPWGSMQGHGPEDFIQSFGQSQGGGSSHGQF